MKTLINILIFCGILCAATLNAQTTWNIGSPTDTDVTATLDAGTLTISGTGAMMNWSTNSTVPWYSVRTSITTITIDDGVTTIGQLAFNGCSSLTEVIIPNTVTTIGERAFESCQSLTEVTIPNSVTSIGNYAFYNCRSLTEVTIPNSVITIGNFAFSGCSSLTSVTVQWISPLDINSNVFYNCGTIAVTLVVPQGTENLYFAADVWKDFYIEGITEPIGGMCGDNLTWSYDVASATLTISGIGDMYMSYFFLYNENWRSFSNKIRFLALPDGITTIVAFSGCSSLTEVTIPNSVTTIGEWAFNGCSSLTDVTIGNSVTTIGDEAFYNCNSLTAVTIPNSVTSIGNSAFARCSNLTEITNHAIFPQSIDANVFEYINISQITLRVPVASEPVYRAAEVWKYFSIGDPKCENIIANGYVTEDMTWDLFDCGTLTITGTGEMPYESPGYFVVSNFDYCEFLLVIYNAAPWDYYHLIINSVFVCEGIAAIGLGAFVGLANLTEINVDVDNENYSSAAGVLFNKNQTTLIKYPDGKQGGYIIPNSVTTIGECAFSNCSNLTEVNIPNSVTTIGGSAFAFCSNLTEVNIPNSVTTIGGWAFSNCNNLIEITNHAGVPQSIYADCSVDISKITLRVPAASEAAYRVADVWKGFNIVGIGDPACESIIASGKLTDDIRWVLCDGGTLTVSGTGDMPDWISGAQPWSNQTITAVIIEDGVTSIGNTAFYYCHELTSLTIPEGLTYIGSFSFTDCRYLTSLTLPESMVTIGASAFNTTGLVSVSIPAGVKSIGNYAFASCSDLQFLSVASGNTDYSSAGGVLFNKDQTTLIQYPGGKQGGYTIPNTVNTIGDYAFANCSNLTDVFIPTSVTVIGDYAFENCIGLTEIVSHSAAPQTIKANVFSGVPKNTCTLYVPVGSVSAYRAAEGWGEFENILELGSVPAVITIKEQPAAVTEVSECYITGRLTVAARATQDATLAYQWYSNTAASNEGGVLIAGANNATFEIPANLRAGTHYFYCEVVAAYEAMPVTSEIAMVNVIPEFIPEVEPPVGYFLFGAISGSLSVEMLCASEGLTYTYQWYSNNSASNTGGTVISGAVGASYPLSASLALGTHYYYCLVSASGVSGDAKRTNVATVTVREIEEIAVTPTSGQSKIYGASDPPFTYAHAELMDGDAISGVLEREAGEDVGEYAFTLGTLSAGSFYSLVLSGGVSFAITQATVTDVTTVIAPFSLSAFEAQAAPTTVAIAELAGLPPVVTVATDAPLTETLPVTWSTADAYNAKGAAYNFAGTLAGNANIAAGGITAQATVEIVPVVASNPSFADTEVGASAETAATASSLGATVLPVTGNITVEGVAVNYTVNWGSQTLDRTIIGGSATFTGTVTYTNAPAWLTLPASSDVSRKVTVTAKTQVVISGIAPNANLTYDATPKYVNITSANAGAAGTEGLLYSYAGINGTSYVASETAPVNVGNYRCTVTLDHVLYSAQPLDIDFSITQSTVASVTTVIPTFSRTAYEAREATTTSALATFASLPAVVTVATDTDLSETLSATWSTTDAYNAKGAAYNFSGTLAGTANIAAGSVTAQATVEIVPVVASNPDFTDTEVITNTETAATANSLGATVLPVSGNITVEGVTINYTVNWGAEILDRTIVGGSTIFNGTVSYTNAPAWLTLPASAVVSRKVSVSAKADPSYTVPTGLTAYYSQTLSTIELPSGWEWETPDDAVGEVGTQTHKATFTPEDTDNYNVITGIDVQVDVREYIRVTGISLPEQYITVTKGETQKIHYVITPANAVNKDVRWYNSYPEIATIDSEGIVTAKTAGHTNIMVYTVDGSFSAQCVVYVIDVMSVNEHFLSELRIYPNPFTGAVRITGAVADVGAGLAPAQQKGRGQAVPLRIIDAAGVVVHTQMINGNDEIIDLKHLPAGVYIFRFEKDGNVKTVKVVRN